MLAQMQCHAHRRCLAKIYWILVLGATSLAQRLSSLYLFPGGED